MADSVHEAQPGRPAEEARRPGPSDRSAAPKKVAPPAAKVQLGHEVADDFEVKPAGPYRHGGVPDAPRPEPEVSRVTRPHFARLLALPPAQRAALEQPIQRAMVEAFGLRNATVRAIPGAALPQVIEGLVAMRAPGAPLTLDVPQEGRDPVRVEFRVVRLEADGKNAIYARPEGGVLTALFRCPIAA